MEILPTEMDNLIVISYFLSATLYTAFFFLIIINKKIIKILRFGLSSLFLAIGWFFFIEGGNLYTKGVYQYLTPLALITSLLVSITGFVVVYILYSISKDQ
jgi:hypothetical protein